MGRRSRKRSSAPADTGEAPSPAETGAPAGEPAPAAAPPPRRARPATRRARIDEAPQAPWHPFPLVELAILAGIILLVLGFVTEGERREVFFLGGLALVGIASLELVIREHFAGYRSHTALLALATAFLVGAPVYVLGGSRPATIAAGVAGGAVAFLLLRAAFARRSGGMSWRA